MFHQSVLVPCILKSNELVQVNKTFSLVLKEQTLFNFEKFTFYPNPLSFDNIDEPLRRFGIQILLPNGQRFTKFKTGKNANYKTTSTDRTLLKFKKTESN